MIIDIDFLRQFESRYGLKLRKFVVAHVEQVLNESLREYDAVISRYEAEEFVVSIPLSSADNGDRMRAARTIAKQLSSDVEANFLQFGSERLTVTISGGLAVAAEGLLSDRLIGMADDALDAAKKAGRNRCYYHTGSMCLPVEEHCTIAKGEATRALASESSHEELDLADSKTRFSSKGERRRHQRKPCNNVHLIAPCHDRELPAMCNFQRAQFFDISVSGFSMILPTIPATDRFAVALISSDGIIFVAAEVANVRRQQRAGTNDKPLVIVGCRFCQRLLPTSASLEPAS